MGWTKVYRCLSLLGGIAMHRILAWLFAVSVVATSAQAQETAQQVSTNKVAAPSSDVLRNVRADMQANRADIMAKSLTLTAGQAAKFWPLFEAYQRSRTSS
jgi:hypothetical protein